MIRAALLAVRQALSPPFRTVLLKSVGLALLLLVLFGAVLDWLLARLIDFSNPTIDLVATVVAALGVFAGLIFLVPPVTSLVAGIFLDEIAADVERTHYRNDAPGEALPLGRSILLSLKFFFTVVLVNIVVLLFLFVPVVNVAVYLVGNGYLLGREYFEFAALRFRTEEDAKALRRANALKVFLGGVLVAAFAAIPLVNLATPLVATAFMVHLHKQISRRERLSSPSP